MTSIENHVSYALGNAQVKKWPFSHFYVENAFPHDFYRQMLGFLYKKEDYQGGTQYKGRKFADNSMIPGLEFMLGPEFMKAVITPFQGEFNRRFVGKTFTPRVDLRLIRDGKGYSIGPHTDAAWKVLSLLFYLPDDYSHQECGTSLYVPKQRGKVCPGGPHHKFEDFNLVTTVPYRPNSCMGFWKTENSWHGVEPVEADFNRDVLLYNIYEATPNGN